MAAQQHGAVTTRQLAAAGLGPGAVRVRVERGQLRRLHRGVYLAGVVEASLTRQAAAVLVCGRSAALSRWSAAAMWGLCPDPSDEVHVTVAGGGARNRPGIRVHRTECWEPGDVLEREGIPLTSPVRTLADLAFIAAPREYRRMFDEVLVRRLAEPAAMPAVALRHASGDEPSLTRSEAERRFLELVRAAALPRPVTNTRIGRHEVDFLWPAQRVIVEVDGYAYHSTRAAFERDRARDAELQAAGYRVLRFTWRQITREPELVVARLAAALA